MAVEKRLTLRVRTLEDALWARQEAKRFAARVPLAEADVQRIELVASELASNLVKHAHGGGTLHVERVSDARREGVRLIAVDSGPGIADVALALTPGYSTAGSLGDGLAAVRELVDAFEIDSAPGQGTRVEVLKWAP